MDDAVYLDGELAAPPYDLIRRADEETFPASDPPFWMPMVKG